MYKTLVNSGDNLPTSTGVGFLNHQQWSYKLGPAHSQWVLSENIGSMAEPLYIYPIRLEWLSDMGSMYRVIAKYANVPQILWGGWWRFIKVPKVKND